MKLNQGDFTHPRPRPSFAAGLDDFECTDILKQEVLILDFPPDIISLILIRLSVQTLSILKCVNTYFSRFISSSEFIRDHLKFSSQDASMSSYNVMFENYNDLKLRQTSIQSFCHDVYNLVYLEHPEINLHLVSSCNGLVLIIVSYEHLYLWNPTIKKHKKLPSIAGNKNLDFGYYTRPRFCCGVGFDAPNDDYKVVALFDASNDDPKSNCLRLKETDVTYAVNVYSLKRNSWIRIPDFTVGELSCFSGTFASGKLHWCTKNGDIVSFDVETEVFGILDHPKYVQGFSYILRLLGGYITLCCYNDGYVDVWVMKEYGMLGSWTKMFILSEYTHKGKVCPRPFYILPNGEVLNNHGVFHIYNPKDDSWRFTKIWFFSDPIIYIESLVSPCCN